MMQLVMPDLARVGPCDVVVSVTVGELTLARLELLEAIAASARLHLERPEETDRAGWLADALAVAGFPIREGGDEDAVRGLPPPRAGVPAPEDDPLEGERRLHRPRLPRLP
ncbi:MAG: hypothetical protein AB7G23_21080, partial [Vicinamibacterales bacterium]